MASHMPGPWTNLHDTWILSANAGTVVHGAMRPEDAVLIAAAPDLLAALKAVQRSEWFKSLAEGGECITLVRAAIAKAEGRS